MTSKPSFLNLDLERSPSDALALLEQEVFECEQLLTHARDLTSLMQAQSSLNAQPEYSEVKNSPAQKHLNLRKEIAAKQQHLQRFKRKLLALHQENKNPAPSQQSLNQNLKQTLVEIQYYRLCWRQLLQSLEHR